MPTTLSRPLTLNDRAHYMVRAAAVRRLRHEAYIQAKAAGIPALERIQVEVHYVPRDRRRRDPLNLVATLKAIEDGIVDAGVIPDDTPDHSVPTMPIIQPADPAYTGPRIYAIVREVTA